MWWKYALECLLAFAALALGQSFWSILKSPRFFRSSITDPKMLDDIISTLGHDRLRREGPDIKPVFGSYYRNILLFQNTSRLALRRTRNLVLVMVAIVFACSYLLGAGFSILSAVVFCAAGIAPIANSAKNNVMNDILPVLLNVYKWNLEDAAECSATILRDAPWLQTTLLAVKKVG